MIPTPEQKRWLKDYLSQIMVYRETYEEVYDHMLLAIEHQPDEPWFETIIMNVIEQDFGGNNGLLELEESCKHAVEVNAWAQYRQDFNRCFTSPLALVTAIVFAGFYMQFPIVKTGGALILLFVFLLVLHPLLAAVRGFKSGYTYGSRKASVKDKIFRQITFSSIKMLWGVFLMLQVLDGITGYLYDFDVTIGRVVALAFIFFFSWPYFRVIVLRKKRRNESVRFNPEFPITPTLWRIFLVMFVIDLSAKYLFGTNQWATEKNVSISIVYAIGTGILILFIVHIFVVIRLYRREFKTNMITN
jgi:hypothetical protein